MTVHRHIKHNKSNSNDLFPCKMHTLIWKMNAKHFMCKAPKCHSTSNLYEWYKCRKVFEMCLNRFVNEFLLVRVLKMPNTCTSVCGTLLKSFEETWSSFMCRRPITTKMQPTQFIEQSVQCSVGNVEQRTNPQKITEWKNQQKNDIECCTVVGCTVLQCKHSGCAFAKQWAHKTRCICIVAAPSAVKSLESQLCDKHSNVARTELVTWNIV